MNEPCLAAELSHWVDWAFGPNPWPSGPPVERVKSLSGSDRPQTCACVIGLAPHACSLSCARPAQLGRTFAFMAMERRFLRSVSCDGSRVRPCQQESPLVNTFMFIIAEEDEAEEVRKAAPPGRVFRVPCDVGEPSEVALLGPDSSARLL